MDVLLLELEKSKFGSRFCGSFGYADNVCILAPSHNTNQSMLNVCQGRMYTLMPVKASYYCSTVLQILKILN